MKEYYNILDSGYNAFEFVRIGLIITIVGIGVIIFMIKTNRKSSQKIFAYVMTGFALLWTLIASVSTGRDYLESKSAIKNGTFKEIEGIVENFNPMPYEGNKYESFTVKGVKFSYSDYEVIAGFNKTKSHGGPIDEGKYVKIRYYEGKILQLWIKE